MSLARLFYIVRAFCLWITLLLYEIPIINWKTIQQRSDEYWIPKTKLRHRMVKMWLSLDEALSYERVNKSWVEWVIRSNRDNRRIVQNIIEWKIKRKFFKELNEAIEYKKNARVPTK